MQLVMQRLTQKFWLLLEHDDGQDLVEYALLALMIACASIASLKSLAPQLLSLWTFIDTTISGVL
jgi:Flp pilus assembly pilin Flp